MNAKSDFKIVVASANPVKAGAIEDAFKRLAGGDNGRDGNPIQQLLNWTKGDRDGDATKDLPVKKKQVSVITVNQGIIEDVSYVADVEVLTKKLVGTCQ